MTPENLKAMRERFGEKFITKQISNGYTEICDFECSQKTPSLIIDFIESEINQALAEREKEIVKNLEMKRYDIPNKSEKIIFDAVITAIKSQGTV